MIEVEVVGVRIELPSNQPLVLLRETAGERHLPIWIGAPEASAIAFVQQGIVPPRPMTHDLLVDVVAAAGKKIAEVRITSVEDTVYHAQLVFSDGVTVSSRASDALAVALPCTVPHLLRRRGPCRRRRRDRGRGCRGFGGGRHGGDRREGGPPVP